jgi:FkbM family methyltransferase
MLRALNRALGALGLELARVGRSGWTPAHLRRYGFAPRTLVDVGVGSGTPALYAAFPDAELVLVEPLAEFEPDLQRIVAERSGRYLLAAVGATSQERSIHVEPGNRLKSSFLRRARLTTTGDPLETRRVPVTTLDELREKHGLVAPFGLKLDTEGFELEAIRGAPRFLEDTLFVIAEVSMARRFEGGYAFAEFVAVLAEHDFRACDVLEVARGSRGPETPHLDLLFRRETSLQESVAG